MLTLRPASTLDGGDLGWLKAKHHFVVSSEGNPANQPLGALIVWNDDEVSPGTGFGMHGHRDMEIITYVRAGVVTHRDTAGNVGYTVAGDVQVMSAGTGIRHSEHNQGTEPLQLFQIWIRPRQLGIAPRWAARRFPRNRHVNEIVALASGYPSDSDALPIEADARVLGATLLAGETLRHQLIGFTHAYLAPAKGSIEVNGQIMTVGDGLSVVDEPELKITAREDAEFILVTVV